MLRFENRNKNFLNFVPNSHLNFKWCCFRDWLISQLIDLSIVIFF
jgi:hypothetical protein